MAYGCKIGIKRECDGCGECVIRRTDREDYDYEYGYDYETEDGDDEEWSFMSGTEFWR